MGIRGLLSMIKSDSVFEMVDLVGEADKQGGIEILVDFNAFMRFISEILVRKMAVDYDNEYLYFPIGCYDVESQAISDLHNGFKDAGINLVWMVDGPKGVDEVASDQKSETWLNRVKGEIFLMKEVLSAARLKLPLHNLNNLSPIGSFQSALGALKRAGAEVVRLLQGECDDFIAYEFHRRNSFAILTNDTDFVIFRDCAVIFEQLLSQNYERENLKLPFIDFDDPGKIFKKPSSLRCPLVRQNHILRLFQFSHQSELIALSILKGNDNTSKFSDELMYHLQITKNPNKSPHVTHVAQYIRKKALTSDNLEDLQEVKMFIVNYPQFKESIQFCKDLYSLKRIKENLEKSIVIFDTSTIDDSLTGFLARKLTYGEIGTGVYGVHFGILHGGVSLEQPSENCPPIWNLLSEIMNRIYPYLLVERRDCVVEWRCHSDNPIVRVPVQHADVKTNMIKGKPDEDSDTSEKYGIDLFEEVICHMEIDGPLTLVARYGIEKGFICHILRYMFLLTREKNLRLSKEEFRSLFLTVFFQYSRSKDIKFRTQLNQDVFLGMKICPTERCLITATWFMNIYYISKYECGGAFNLTEDFPEPSLVMSGAVFYTFYENSMSDVNGRTSHLEESLLQSSDVLQRDIMARYGDEYAVITA